MSEPVSTDGAPKAIGPYSQGIDAGNYLFCSGQIGLDPSTAELVDGGIKPQTERALQNLKAVVVAGGHSLEDVVKTTVFLDSMDDFVAMNEVYAEFFGEPYPARSTVAVKQLPRGALVEVEAVVFRSG